MHVFIFRVVALMLLVLPLVANVSIPPPSPLTLQRFVAKESSPIAFIHEQRVAKRLKKYLIKIFKQTQRASRKGYNVLGEHIKLDKKIIKKMQRKTRVIRKPKQICTGQNTYSTQILVTRRDITAAARDHAGKGLATVAVNPAHPRRPGDNVFWGKMTEEAAIFRVSDYFLSLFPHLNTTLKHQLHGGTYRVPQFGGIYSPHVFVFREIQDANFRYIDQPVEVALIASTPLNMCHHSSLHSSPGSRERYVHRLKEKIRAILRIAASKQRVAVVLNDYGCIERHNHPKIVSQTFKKVLLESEFKGVFKTIDFAIPTSAALTSQVFLDFSRALNGLVQ